MLTAFRLAVVLEALLTSGYSQARGWPENSAPQKYVDNLDVERSRAVTLDRIETVIIDPKHRRAVR